MGNVVPIEASDVVTRDEAIARARIDGLSVARIARKFGVPVQLVEGVLERAYVTLDARQRADSLAVQIERMELLHEAHWPHALDRDPVSTSAVVHISKHLAELRGLLMQKQDPVQIAEAAAVPQASSMDRITAALDALVAQPRSLVAARAEAHHGPPEREREAVGVSTTLQASRAG